MFVVFSLILIGVGLIWGCASNDKANANDEIVIADSVYAKNFVLVDDD